MFNIHTTAYHLQLITSLHLLPLKCSVLEWTKCMWGDPQCSSNGDSVIDLAKFHHFGKILKAVGYFEGVYLVFVKSLYLLWQILNDFGQILNDFWQTFIVLKDQILHRKFSHLVTLNGDLLPRCILNIVFPLFVG